MLDCAEQVQMQKYKTHAYDTQNSRCPNNQSQNPSQTAEKKKERKKKVPIKTKYRCIDLTDCNGYEDWLALHNEGVLFIKPNSTTVPFPVFCDRLPAGTIRTRVAVRRDTTTNFNRTWLEYRNGFGEPNSSAFWLGLERLHQLTRTGRFQLRFTIRLDNATTFYQFYDNFVIGNESANFAMSFLLPVVGRNLGDCLQDLLGVGFSTYDMDNDNSSTNCAQQHGAGWWFKGDNCSACNPFGPIVPPFTGFRKGLEGEAFWIHNLGDMIPFPISFYLVA